MTRVLKHFLATLGVVLGIFLCGGAVAAVVEACTPAQRAIVRDVKAVLDPLVDCLLSRPAGEDLDTSLVVGGCGPKGSGDPERDRAVGMAAIEHRDRIASSRLGCAKPDAGAKR